MITKATKALTLTLALVAGSLLAGTMATPSFARDGGGPGIQQNCHTAGCPHVKKVKKVRKKKARRKSRPWASSFDRDTGRRITSVGNGDGTRTVIGIGAGFGPFGIQIWTSP